MNKLMQRLVLWMIKFENQEHHKLTKYRNAKNLKRLGISAQHFLRDTVMMLTGVLCAGFGLKGFLLPNQFLDGGVSGISLLLHRLQGWPLPVLIICINLPFMLIAFRIIGRWFALRSIGAVFFLAIAVAVIPYPVVTSDKLLIAVFGGFFLGAGIGLAVRGGSVLDGTEILAIYLSRGTGLTIGDVILIFNIMIFGFAAWLLSVEVALYAILTYLSAARTVDFVIEGLEEYTGVTIVSSHHDEIREMISKLLGRGVTIYQGKRGFGKRGRMEEEIDILYTVITRLEVGKLQTEVQKIDPNAFVVTHSIKDTRGGMIKRRPMH